MFQQTYETHKYTHIKKRLKVLVTYHMLVCMYTSYIGVLVCKTCSAFSNICTHTHLFDIQWKNLWWPGSVRSSRCSRSSAYIYTHMHVCIVVWWVISCRAHYLTAINCDKASLNYCVFKQRMEVEYGHSLLPRPQSLWQPIWSEKAQDRKTQQRGLRWLPSPSTTNHF